MLNIENIKLLFSNSHTEINENHNEAFTAFNNYLKKTEKKIPILVNFDTHSDLYQNYKFININKNIANWVNFCIKEFNLEEFYWIIPDYIAQNSVYRKKFQEKTNLNFNCPFKCFDDEKIDLKKVNMRELYFNNKTGEIITLLRENNLKKNCKLFNMPSVFEQIPDLRKIRIYILTKHNLDILKGKEVLLSIDADYFCNSGFDTLDNINNKFITQEELNNSFNEFIKTLLQADIAIPSVSLTYSPIYMPKNLRPEFEKFYNTIKEASNNK